MAAKPKATKAPAVPDDCQCQARGGTVEQQDPLRNGPPPVPEQPPVPEDQKTERSA